MSALKQTKGLTTFRAGLVASKKALQDKIFQVVLKGMSLLETTLMEHKDISIEGSHQLLQKNSFKELYLRLGDNNPRLRERAEDLLMLVATLKNFSSPN
jgi:hypothetical protein